MAGNFHAAIATDDSAAFTEAIEISMRAGAKLRASNLMLPVIVGCGFEVAVYRSLRSVPAPTVWPRSEPLKWVAALDLVLPRRSIYESLLRLEGERAAIR